jgi:hypothetical protein
MDKCTCLRGNTNLSSEYSEVQYSEAHCDASVYLYYSSSSEPGILDRTVEEQIRDLSSEIFISEFILNLENNRGHLHKF